MSYKLQCANSCLLIDVAIERPSSKTCLCIVCVPSVYPEEQHVFNIDNQACTPMNNICLHNYAQSPY